MLTYNGQQFLHFFKLLDLHFVLLEMVDVLHRVKDGQNEVLRERVPQVSRDALDLAPDHLEPQKLLVLVHGENNLLLSLRLLKSYDFWNRVFLVKRKLL